MINHRFEQIDQIYKNFEVFVKSNDCCQAEWFVGITSNPKRKIFEEHKVSELDGVFMFNNTKSPSEAIELRNQLLEKLGLKGKKDYDGNYQTWVYVYQITNRTNQLD